MMDAKKMNETELNKVTGAGLDTINYILQHQKAAALPAKPPVIQPDRFDPPVFPEPGPVDKKIWTRQKRSFEVHRMGVTVSHLLATMPVENLLLDL